MRPSAARRRITPNKAVALLRRQHRGRLVEDEDARVAIERLQDLDALAHADGQIADHGVGVDGEAMALREIGDLRRARRAGR